MGRLNIRARRGSLRCCQTGERDREGGIVFKSHHLERLGLSSILQQPGEEGEVKLLCYGVCVCVCVCVWVLVCVCMCVGALVQKVWLAHEEVVSPECKRMSVYLNQNGFC